MKKTKLYYIETTLNGYVFYKYEIKSYEDYKEGKIDLEDLIYGHMTIVDSFGNEENYPDDCAGNLEELETFIEKTSSKNLKDFQEDNHLNVRPDTYIEYYRTDSVGWYDDRYIGLRFYEEDVIK